MKTTPEKLVELKAMAKHARSHFCIELAEAFVRAVPALIADLEEAREQLASPYMDGYEAAKEEHRPQIIAAEAELAATRKQLAEAQALVSQYRNALLDGPENTTLYVTEQLESMCESAALDAAIAEAIADEKRKEAAAIAAKGDPNEQP